MAACTDALSRSWSHTLRLLFQPFRLIYWIKAALLVFLIQGISLLNLHLNYEELMTSGYETLAEEAMKQLPTIITLLMVYFLLTILFDFLSACARFALYEGIAQGVLYYLASFQRLMPQIIAFFLWNFIVKFLFLLTLTVGFFIMLTAAWFLTASFEQTTALILIVTLNLILLTILGVLVALYLVLFNSMVAPLMAIQQKGIFEAWGTSLRLALENMGDFLGYAVLRFLLVLCSVFILFWFNLIVGILSFGYYTPYFNPIELGVARALLLWLLSSPFEFILTFFLLPLPVLQNAYALSFMARLTGAEELEPRGGEDEIKNPESLEPIPDTGPFVAASTSFKDIPTSPGGTAALSSGGADGSASSPMDESPNPPPPPAE
ncbi:MAG: hypothetical protein ACE15F_16550 [bacterium]